MPKLTPEERERKRAAWARAKERTNQKRREKWAREGAITNERRREKYLASHPNAVPRGPQSPPKDMYHIPAGHELAGRSTLTDANGHVRGAWDKTRVAGADTPPTEVPPSFLLRSTSVLQRGDGTTSVQWSAYDRAKVAAWEDEKAAIVAHVKEYVRASAPAILDAGAAMSSESYRQLVGTKDDLLTVYPLGDPHIGMLAWAAEVGEHFDVRIAERELCECMIQLVARAPASTEAIVVNLGDFWHAEDDAQKTPGHGNKLDVDGRSGKVGRIGLSILRRLIDTALAKHARVRFRTVPGNHDPRSSFWIQEVLRAAYEQEPRVVIEDPFNRYQYDTFGTTMLGWAHGDGAKVEALESIMLADRPQECGAAKFRYWHTGHRHHWETKEFRTCVVHTHRTLAGRDAWHHGQGYRSGRALKVITYHKEWGLDGESVVGVERVRAAIEQRKAA